MPDPAAPLRTCDIVMKGGITSGVVYPQAITALARRFRLVNIGGTSAGAIAAAIAAAAEHRRQTGGGDAGFAFLDELPGLLGETVGAKGRTRLFGFFQPARRTRRLFAVATAALGGGASAALGVLSALSVHYAAALLLGLLPGLLLGGLSAFALAGSPLAWVWLGLGLFVALIGATLAAALALLFDLARELPRNGYGLCSGISDTKPGEDRPELEPLTEWLAGYLDRTAGLPPGTGPLTFGHLWGTHESDAELATRRVNLEMMTTNLTHGRPYRIPFRADSDLHENHLFYFRPDEFARLFPTHIVAWMVAHPRAGNDDPKRLARRARLAALGYHPLPAPADLPVVVATRMSLSFPVLLSAVPLHAIDRGEFPKNEQPERCWFSDGGICSNFPLHFFDTALPRRPTFSIDLTAKSADATPDALRPKMDDYNSDSFNERWNRFDTSMPARAGELPASKPGHLGLLGFFGAIVGTMQNWTDATQGRLPGYRDRIVRVPLTPEEGGLNLAMPPERIRALTERGIAAAGLLIDHFDEPARHPKMTWENHRWIRLRAYLASLENPSINSSTPATSPRTATVPTNAGWRTFWPAPVRKRLVTPWTKDSLRRPRTPWPSSAGYKPSGTRNPLPRTPPAPAPSCARALRSEAVHPPLSSELFHQQHHPHETSHYLQ